jgi:hypothetical protein
MFMDDDQRQCCSRHPGALADCTHDGLAITTFISTLAADFIAHPAKPDSPLWRHGEALITAVGAATVRLMASHLPFRATVERLKKPGFDDICSDFRSTQLLIFASHLADVVGFAANKLAANKPAAAPAAAALLLQSERPITRFLWPA